MGFMVRTAALSALAIAAILAVGVGEGSDVAKLWATGLIAMHAKVSATCILALAAWNVASKKA